MCWCCSSRRVRRCTENKPGQHRFRNGTSAGRRRGWTKTGIVRGETRPELRLVSSNRPQRPQNKVHACRLISTARHAYIELCDCFAGRNAQSGELSKGRLAGIVPSHFLCSLRPRKTNISHTQVRLLRSYVTGQELMFWALVFSNSGEVLGRCDTYMSKPKAGISVPLSHLFTLYATRVLHLARSQHPHTFSRSSYIAYQSAFRKRWRNSYKVIAR